MCRLLGFISVFLWLMAQSIPRVPLPPGEMSIPAVGNLSENLCPSGEVAPVVPGWGTCMHNFLSPTVGVFVWTAQHNLRHLQLSPHPPPQNDKCLTNAQGVGEGDGYAWNWLSHYILICHGVFTYLLVYFSVVWLKKIFFIKAIKMLKMMDLFPVLHVSIVDLFTSFSL